MSSTVGADYIDYLFIYDFPFSATTLRGTKQLCHDGCRGELLFAPTANIPTQRKGETGIHLASPFWFFSPT